MWLVGVGPHSDGSLNFKEPLGHIFISAGPNISLNLVGPSAQRTRSSKTYQKHFVEPFTNFINVELGKNYSLEALSPSVIM